MRTYSRLKPPATPASDTSALAAVLAANFAAQRALAAARLAADALAPNGGAR
jgi:hypothetical protein